MSPRTPISKHPSVLALTSTPLSIGEAGRIIVELTQGSSRRAKAASRRAREAEETMNTDKKTNQIANSAIPRTNLGNKRARNEDEEQATDESSSRKKNNRSFRLHSRLDLFSTPDQSRRSETPTPAPRSRLEATTTRSRVREKAQQQATIRGETLPAADEPEAQLYERTLLGDAAVVRRAMYEQRFGNYKSPMLSYLERICEAPLSRERSTAGNKRQNGKPKQRTVCMEAKRRAKELLEAREARIRHCEYLWGLCRFKLFVEVEIAAGRRERQFYDGKVPPPFAQVKLDRLAKLSRTNPSRLERARDVVTGRIQDVLVAILNYHEDITWIAQTPESHTGIGLPATEVREMLESHAHGTLEPLAARITGMDEMMALVDWATAFVQEAGLVDVDGTVITDTQVLDFLRSECFNCFVHTVLLDPPEQQQQQQQERAEDNGTSATVPSSPPSTASTASSQQREQRRAAAATAGAFALDQMIDAGGPGLRALMLRRELDKRKPQL